ncbi:tripartite tricarboxylate transporter TctB family protein [Acidaminococcus massiliensis]|uniref:tripartite tricarboxylate transporter TctB family protein n=1 Tax=Acidaminococcus massiliensis TaxID=1852375 RepID=UPI0026DCC3DC|nr:tripartite tricarboxylate transporter TctB family protein [Acidaminococcus massiliensis]
MDSRRKDIYSSVFFIVLAVAYYFQTYSIRSYKSFDVTVLTSASIPRVLAVILLILSVIQIVSCCMKVKEKKYNTTDNREQVTPQKEETAELDIEKELQIAQKNEENEKYDIKDIIFTVVFLIVYLLVMDSLGFVISTFLYMVAQITLMTKKAERKKKALFCLVLSAFSSFLIFYLFNDVLGMILPIGPIDF